MYNYYTEPPFQIRLINSSPRVNERRLIVDFEPTMPLLSAECFLIGGRGTDCKWLRHHACIYNHKYIYAHIY